MAKNMISTEDNELAELDFSIDGFHNQKVVKGLQAYALLFKRLLLMKKGTYPSMPECGIDLGSYRFSDIDSLVGGSLKNEIQRQAKLYMPQIPLDDIKVSKLQYKGDWILFISVTLLGERKTLSAAFLQKKHSIISSKVTVEDQKFINVKGSD